VNNVQQDIVEQIRKELGACEDTEHLIDWTIDLWSTFAILIDRFGEARAIQIVTASESLPHPRKHKATLV
jgi:hypothetical protein